MISILFDVQVYCLQYPILFFIIQSKNAKKDETTFLENETKIYENRKKKNLVGKKSQY